MASGAIVGAGFLLFAAGFITGIMVMLSGDHRYIMMTLSGMLDKDVVLNMAQSGPIHTLTTKKGITSGDFGWV